LQSEVPTMGWHNESPHKSTGTDEKAASRAMLIILIMWRAGEPEARAEAKQAKGNEAERSGNGRRAELNDVEQGVRLNESPQKFDRELNLFFHRGGLESPN